MVSGCVTIVTVAISERDDSDSLITDQCSAIIFNTMTCANQNQNRVAANPLPRIIMAGFGTTGDILPFAAMAKMLAARGHQVEMLVPTFHASLIESMGISHTLFGTLEEVQSILDDKNLWNDRLGFGIVWKGLQPHLGIVRAVSKEQSPASRCLLLCHPILLPLADIARSFRPDLHIVCASLAPSNFCSSYDFQTAGALRVARWLPLALRRSLWRIIFKFWIDPVTLPGLNAFRSANKLPVVASFQDHLQQIPDMSISLFPDWFASAQPDWPVPFLQGDFPVLPSGATAALSPSLEAFLSAGELPVAFTPGTGNLHAGKYFAIALKALKRSGRRGLLITPHAAQIPPDLPPDIVWLSHAPFDLLFPRLAAVVHHGGIGTTAQAFRCGIPQIIIPYAFDQFDNGLRAQKLGVADVLFPRQMTARRLHKRLVRLLSSSDVAQTCVEISRRMEQASTQTLLVQQLEQALGITPAAPA